MDPLYTAIYIISLAVVFAIGFYTGHAQGYLLKCEETQQDDDKPPIYSAADVGRKVRILQSPYVGTHQVGDIVEIIGVTFPDILDLISEESKAKYPKGLSLTSKHVELIN